MLSQFELFLAGAQW